MGRRGPKPQPTALKLLHGNPGKRRLPTSEPKPRAAKTMRPPAHLDEEARREWARVGRELRAVGLLTVLDRAALAGYCVAWSRWCDAEAKLREFGAVIRSAKGFPVLSPYFYTANAALGQMRQFLAEFGMSPASRSRIETEDSAVPPLPEQTHGKPQAARFFSD